MHAGPLEPGPDRYFASGLQDAGGGSQTLYVELWTAHALAIAKDVDGTLGRFTGGGDMGPKRADDREILPG